MWWRSKFRLEEVRRDLRADTLHVRQMAMQTLMQRVKDDYGIHPDALQIFRTMLDVEQDPFSPVNPAQINAFGQDLQAGNSSLT